MMVVYTDSAVKWAAVRSPMTNGKMSRKEMVLAFLRSHSNDWVDGPDIANAEVGGSEGLKRLRELRADGHNILMRAHPDPKRDIHQYQLVVPKSEVGKWACSRCGHNQVEKPIPRQTPMYDNYMEAACPECGKYTIWMLRRTNPA